MATSLISISIPCYNEEKRLPEKLRPYLDWLEKNLPDYELVLVNDGSTDKTLEVLNNLAKENPKIKIVHNGQNRGRGFGMKTGVLASSGTYILETDADLPVSPDHILKFMDFLEKNPEYAFVIGSREHPESGFVVKQPFIRVFAGKVFHRIFMLFFGSQFKDVMCGFKMFRHDVAKEIFQYVYDEKYLAAGEIIFVANKFGLKVKEMPVVWEDDRRSKVKVVRDTFRTLGGLLKLSIRNLQGKYDRKRS
jgi:dolichyl-phosphate beta-glucosyltransferase